MYIVVIAWFYVVVLMAVVEATSSNGTLLGAIITLLLYGLLPLSIVLYIFGTPARKRQLLAQRMQERAEWEAAQAAQIEQPSAQPDTSSHATGSSDATAIAGSTPIPPMRKET